MNSSEALVEAGFKYHLEHLRRVDVMREMGLSIEGLKKADVLSRKKTEGLFATVLAWTQAKIGLDRLNFEMVPGVVLSTEDVSNLIPTEGLNYLLGTALTGVAQSSTWYIALFEGNYTPVAGVTAATFPADATECTAYAEASRVTWTPGAISAGSVSNTASKAVFTMNATKTVYGIAQTSVATKSAITGTLISVARFSVAKSVVATDILNVTSTLTATSA